MSNENAKEIFKIVLETSIDAYGHGLSEFFEKIAESEYADQKTVKLIHTALSQYHQAFAEKIEEIAAGFAGEGETKQ